MADTDRPDDELPEQGDEHEVVEKTHVRFTDIGGGALHVGSVSGDVDFHVGPRNRNLPPQGPRPFREGAGTWVRNGRTSISVS